jgi:hypothetical protein
MYKLKRGVLLEFRLTFANSCLHTPFLSITDTLRVFTALLDGTVLKGLSYLDMNRLNTAYSAWCYYYRV